MFGPIPLVHSLYVLSDVKYLHLDQRRVCTFEQPYHSNHPHQALALCDFKAEDIRAHAIELIVQREECKVMMSRNVDQLIYYTTLYVS